MPPRPHFAPAPEGNPATLTFAYGLEGLVAKRRDSRYEPGQRSGAWQKMRVNQKDLPVYVLVVAKGGPKFRRLAEKRAHAYLCHQTFRDANLEGQVFKPARSHETLRRPADH